MRQNDNGEGVRQNGADETFSQDWLSAEGFDEIVAARQFPRVVATLPIFSDEKAQKSKNKRRFLHLRTIFVAFSAFGLGATFAWNGAIFWNSCGETTENATIASVRDDLPTRSGENADDALPFGFASDSLSKITSSTLRSVPDATGETLFAPTEASVFPQYAELESFGGNVVPTSGAGFSTGRFGGDFQPPTDVNVVPTAPVLDPTTTGAIGTDSFWSRRVDFSRNPESGANAANSLAGNAGQFPTWDDLNANVAANSTQNSIQNDGRAIQNGVYSNALSPTENAPNGLYSAELAASNSPVLSSVPTAFPNGAASEHDFIGGENDAILTAENSAPPLGAVENSVVLSNAEDRQDLRWTEINGSNGRNENGRSVAGNFDSTSAQNAGNAQNSDYNKSVESERFVGFAQRVGASENAGFAQRVGASENADFAQRVGASENAGLNANAGNSVSTSAPNRAFVAQLPQDASASANFGAPIAAPTSAPTRNLRW